MKKILILIALGLIALVATHPAPIISDPENMFPSVRMADPIPRFDGDTELYSVPLYSIKNANYYFDVYKALIIYHNEVAKDATTLAVAYDSVATDLRKEKSKAFGHYAVGFLIGAAVGGIAYGIASSN